jgi:hypothetical protein
MKDRICMDKLIIKNIGIVIINVTPLVKEPSSQEQAKNSVPNLLPPINGENDSSS